MKKFWRQKHEQFLASGQSIEEFCSREGLHVGVASRRFEAHSGNSKKEVLDSSVGFWEVSFANERIESVELETPTGMVVRFGSIGVSDLKLLLGI